MRSTVKECMNGFTLQSVSDVPEIDSKAYLMKHDISGARLMFLQNEHEDKAFSIAFKTPPKDNTGVFHILEHSVLCGSRKYPVKEPFVNLLKTSMQTFLKAMTFPDKTMYPVASTNDKDLLNLTDVYLDAVFHPAIYTNPHIFEQEGWHLELENSDASEQDASQASLKFNGVVFNEMKGALSEPEDVLHNVLNEALFPDTLYGFESGGDPAYIPTLTYEEFLDEHRRHYAPQNSYIILYGDVDLEPLLALIDQHLSEAFTERARIPETADKEARQLVYQKPVVSTENIKTLAISPSNTCCAVGYVVGKAYDYTKITALQILVDALGGSNEAPLKRALLDDHICDDVSIYLSDSIAQPYIYIQLKGIEPKTSLKLPDLVKKHIQNIIQEGINPDLVEAALSHAEFYLREHDFGYSDGVIDAMSLMAGWLYDEETPLEALRYIETFKMLRTHLNDGYFEDLAKECFLESQHWASAEIAADSTKISTENERLKALEQALTSEKIQQIEESVTTLRQAQEKPDSPEDIAKLPQLGIKDIDSAKPWGNYELLADTPLPCLRHYLETRGITYLQYYYDLNNVAFEKLPIVAILTTLLGKLNTTQHTAAQIDTLCQSKLGYLVFAPKVVSSDLDIQGYSAFLSMGASALDIKIEEATSVIHEIVHHTEFTDKSRIKDILTQLRVQMEQGFVGMGHSVALARLAAYQKSAGILSQQLSGIDFYLYLKELLDHFDERIDALCEELRMYSQLILRPANCLISFTGSDQSFRAFWDSYKPTDTGEITESASLVVPQPSKNHEAFIVPSDVTYTAFGCDRRLCSSALPYHGSQMVTANATSLDYLWNEVRVKGGAYGAGIRIPALHVIDFYSYRDPHIDETLQRFRNTASWLENFNPDDREFEGYQVSSVSTIDNPVKVRNIIVAQNNAYFQKRSAELRLKTRQEVIESTKEEMRAFAQTLQSVNEQNYYCTIGNKDIIQNAKTDFTVIELF